MSKEEFEVDAGDDGDADHEQDGVQVGNQSVIVGRGLSAVHRGHLRATSGLTEDTLDRLDWWSASASEVRGVLGYADDTPCSGGIVIPYPGTDLVRVRFDIPRPRKEDDRISEQRYATPRASETRAYIPKASRPLLEDPARVIYITEGEKKAEAMAQLGFATIGLAGVSMWSSAADRQAAWDRGIDERPPLPELARYMVKGRRVVIVFDAPDMEGGNEDVVREAACLAKTLVARDCSPELCLLPWDEFLKAWPEPEGPSDPTKAGFDDMLVLLGPERCRQILADTMYAEPSKLLGLYRRGECWVGDKVTIDADFIGKPPDTKWLINWARVWMGPGRAYQKFLGECVKAKWISDTQAEGAIQKARVVSGGTARQWVRDWLASKGAKYSYQTQAVSRFGVHMERDELLAKMRLDRDERDARWWTDRALGDAWTEWTHEQDRAYVDGMRGAVNWKRPTGAPMASPPDDRQLRRWVRAVTDADSEVDVAVVRHFIWQVKRKLAGKRVDHHMMPVLYGKTGGGKTSAIEALLKPLGDLVTRAELDVFSDERQNFRLARSYTVFLDEMGRAEKANVDVLKNRITSPMVHWRRLGTNTEEARPNNATFIGAANREVREIIFDPTSARRYWQVNCAAKLDWATINSISYEEIWQCVSEDELCPLLPYLDVIELRQHLELRAQSLLEQWIDERLERADSAAEGTTSSGLHGDYCDWLDRLGHHQKPTRSKFGRELHQLGHVPGSASNEKRYLFRIKDSIGERSAEVLSRFKVDSAKIAGRPS